MKITHKNRNDKCKFQYFFKLGDIIIGSVMCLTCSENLDFSLDDDWIECESYNSSGDFPKTTTLDKI